MNLDEMVAHSVKHNASDLHLCPGLPPIIRSDGRLHGLDRLRPVSEADINACCERYLNARNRAALHSDGQADAMLTLTGQQRLRGHFFRQRAGISAAFRLIPSKIPDLAWSGVPSAVIELSTRRHGLLLLTGAAGSGKSSSLAALVDNLNHRCQRHIITLEDPVEFIHQPDGCLIQQRQIGEHCRDFNAGLHAALREDPDVILLGELRDAAGIRLALTAAETGHLVLATLHCRHACQAMDRLVEAFPAQEQAFARAMLADSLLAVMAQKLVRREPAGRRALFEVLIATPAARNLIREGKTHLLPGLIQTGKGQGMQTFEQSAMNDSLMPVRPLL